MPNLIAASFADIANSAGYGASNVFGSSVAEPIKYLLRKRAEEARRIFLDELGDGLRPPRDAGEIDEFVAIFYRYMGKAQEGAARLNLRLMARVVRGQLENEGLYASEFLRYSELLASLTREEVILLATRHRMRLAFNAARDRADWSDTQNINDKVVKALVPGVFPDELHVVAALTALQRTGLVWPAGVAAGAGPIWQDTPLLDKVASLAQFEAALARENEGI